MKRFRTSFPHLKNKHLFSVEFTFTRIDHWTRPFTKHILAHLKRTLSDFNPGVFDKDKLCSSVRPCEQERTQLRSPDGPVHHKVYSGASWEFANRTFLHRRVDLDLSHVRVATVLVVGQHSDLDHEGSYGVVHQIQQRDVNPTARLHHL